jgi:hypothetical protein
MIHLNYNRTLKRETAARFQGRAIAIHPQRAQERKAAEESGLISTIFSTIEVRRAN